MQAQDLGADRTRASVLAIHNVGDSGDGLNTSMFPDAIAPARSALSAQIPPTKSAASCRGVFPILQDWAENLVADVKFGTKLVARCCAMGAALCAYAKVPHLALAAALLNIGLSILSDLCDKELRERQERAN